jgi:hypothetical protein
MRATRKQTQKQKRKVRRTRGGGNNTTIREFPKAAPLVPVRGIIGKQPNYLAKCDILNSVNDRKRCHERCDNKPKSCVDEFWG